MKKLSALLLFVVMLSGCAGIHIGKHALKDPMDGVSVRHPVELEKAKIPCVTVITHLGDPAIYTESINGGGVWPLVGSEGKDKDVVGGVSFLIGRTRWIDPLLMSIIPQCGLTNHKFINVNRDDGFGFSLKGLEIYSYEGEGNKRVVFPYDPKKFGEDEKYRQEFIDKYGMTLSEVNDFMLQYRKDNGDDPPNGFSHVKEYLLNSSEWEEFKNQYFNMTGAEEEGTEKMMRYNYRLPSGEVRSSHLPLSQFRKEATLLAGTTGTDRFLRNMNISTTSIMMPWILPFEVLDAAIKAERDKDKLHGLYGRAEAMRYSMAPVIRRIVWEDKMILKERDREIQELRKKLNEK